MLAVLILLCLLVAAVVALAVKSQRLAGWTGVALVTLAPLGIWLALQLTADPARSPLQFEVLGQYHRLADTLHISGDADADVVLGMSSATAARVSFDAASAQLRVEVMRGGAPVLLGERPVNALAIDRRATLRSGADSVVIVRPWLCLRCDTRYVEAAGSRREVRLATLPRIAVGSDTITLFASGGRAYAAARPHARVTIEGDTIPMTLLGAPDTLTIGWPDGDRLLITPVTAAHRLDVRFDERRRARWVLPQTDRDTLRLLVSATTGTPIASVMPVINPAAAAPGAARQPYGGVLELQGGGWSFLSAGSTRAFEMDRAQLLPGPDTERSAGHIVQIRRYDMDHVGARWAVVLAWLLGALSLAWTFRHMHPEALAPRVALLGAVFTLAAVRGTLAFRVWLAPPYDDNSPRTLLALLVAAPALIAILHLWSRAAEYRRAASLRRDAILALLPCGAALAIVLALVLPAWRAPIVETVIATLAIGTIGLALLNRMLLGAAPAEDGRRWRHPLAAVSSPAVEGYTYRQFLAALALLAVLGFLLVVIMQLLRYGALLAAVGWGLILGAALLTAAGPDVLIRRRSRTRPLVTAAAVGLASAAVAWVLRFGVTATVVAFAGGAAFAWILARNASFSVRPVRMRALLALPLAIAVLASLAAVVMPGVVGALRVTAEYALALAGLIAIGRIFSILWFRHVQRLARTVHTRRPAVLPGGIAVGAVVLLLVAAVYVPLVLFDQGLVLLFLAATVTAIALGFYAMGARYLAVLVPVVVATTFVLAMFVTPGSLEDGSAALSTAQIRYAATYHPQELQRHMLTSAEAQPVTTVRTLQQYWGMRHFAAGGTTGRGYFDGGYADWIVPRPVALTENVFSTFLLSEHGWYGGMAVLLCYLLIALTLLYGAVRSTDRAASAPRALLLVGIAAFWLVPALYIAGANGLVLPLTGQNMPMLGLLSRADVALACWLAAFGLCALPGAGSSGIEHVPSAGWSARLRRGTLAAGGVFTAAAAAIIVLLWSPAHAVVGDFALDGVIADVESLVEQGAIEIARGADGDTLGIAAAAAAHPLLVRGGFMRSRLRRANAMSRGEPGGAGCLDADALMRVRDDGGIAVFTALCAIRAAPRSSYDWTGALATAAPVPRYAVGDGRVAVILDPFRDDVVRIGDCAPPGTRSARAVRIGCGADAPVIELGSTAPVLEAAAGDVLLNGVPAQTPTLLRHADHVRGANVDAWVDELPEGALGYARWENSASRRVVHVDGAPWIAQLDTLLARGMANAERAAWRAELTLAPALQAPLSRRLADACAALPQVRRCSALIADPLTGAVLAVASTATQPHRYLPSDPNLRNHPAASAIKPILAAAALHAYPQLRTLEVAHEEAEYSVVANTGVQPSLRAPRAYPGARIPLRGYLGASDNLYSATLGFLATSRRAADGTPELRGQNDLSRLVLNGRPLRGEPSWSGAGSLDLSESPLADALRKLYGVHVHSATVPAFERSFWEPAIAAGALLPSGDLQRITPEPVGLRMDSFRSPRELTSFTIGGDRNRWNNVRLVEALSRIHTGRAVQLHLLRRVGERTLDYPAPQIPAFTSRAEVLDGMAAVTQEPWGTAYALRNVFAPAVTWRAKTGTLREREWVGSVFLFAGGGQPGVCAAAGVVTIELEQAASPDGAATHVFRDAVAPLLRSSMGWDGTRCTEP